MCVSLSLTVAVSLLSADSPRLPAPVPESHVSTTLELVLQMMARLLEVHIIFPIFEEFNFCRRKK